MSNDLKLVEETDGVLWSVRTGGTVFLVVAQLSNLYDVHVVADGGVEHLGQVASHDGALGLIQDELNG